MREFLSRRPGIVVFAAALAVRLFYLAFFPQPPAQFDARQYVSVAAVAPMAVTHPSLWNDTTARENISFDRLMDDIIDGEQVSWFPYDSPTYGQALDWLFFSGPTYPAFLAAVFRLTPFSDFWVVRVLQAILDAATAVLIWLVMKRLISERGGGIAAVIWTVYGPAIIKTGELLTETSAIFLIVLMVWCFLRAYDTQRWSWLAAAGAVCSILAMTKASTTLLIAPMIVAWLWANRKGDLGILRGGGILIGSWLLVMSPWLLLVEHRLGEITVRDPSYGDANFRQANILQTEGYNTDRAPADFWTYPVWREIRNHPSEYARLYLQKFRRLWWRACDDYRFGFPFGVKGVQWFHRLIVLFAAVGVFVWSKRAGPSAWIAIAVIVYFAGLHTLMHVVSRYNLLAMPFVTGAAVCGGSWLVDDRAAGALRRLIMTIGIIAAAIVAVSNLRPAAWLLLPGIDAPLAVYLYWFASAFVIVAAVFLAFSVHGREARTRLLLAPVVGGMIALVFLGWATTREAHAEWAVYIDEPGVTVSREIVLPPDVNTRRVVGANVMIDGLVPRGSAYNIVLDIDHIHTSFADSFLVVKESFYGKPHYRSFMRVNGDLGSNIRGWSKNVIAGTLLDSVLADGIVRVSISLDALPRPDGHLVIFGDLPQENPAIFEGPSQTWTSIERYYESSDPRIWDKLPIEPTASRNFRLAEGKADSTDLSSCFGRQTGQYRILLRLLLADETSLYF